MVTDSRKTPPDESQGDVWFVHDGDCPLCSMAAHAFQIRKTVGNLHLINAREDKEHPLLKEVSNRRLDLDEGMVLIYRNSYYHGVDALHMMALLGSDKGWFNRLNAVLFRSKSFAIFCYPAMRATRNAFLRIQGTHQLRNLLIDPAEPLFKQIFGKQWDVLPPVMKRHYAVRPLSEDVVKLEGHLDVSISPLVSVMARITGMLLAYSGKNIPVTVILRSDETGAVIFDRTFHFNDRGDVNFRSRMEWIKGDELVEFMRFGIGWKLAYEWDGHKVKLTHKGYVLRVLGLTLPIPLALFLGQGLAEEIPLSDDTFSMWTHTTHPLFGKTFGYAGTFKISGQL